MIHREFPFQIKSVSQSGEFEGVASVYNNIDLGDDRICVDAFKKTLNESRGRFPLLADHKIPIGAAICQDSTGGLLVKGVLNLEKEVARDTYSDLKFYQEKAIPYGMSIGFEAIQSHRNGAVRELTEIKLWEISTTLFPMEPNARVLAVKRHGGAGLEKCAAIIDACIRETRASTKRLYR